MLFTLLPLELSICATSYNCRFRAATMFFLSYLAKCAVNNTAECCCSFRVFLRQAVVVGLHFVYRTLVVEVTRTYFVILSEGSVISYILNRRIIKDPCRFRSPLPPKFSLTVHICNDLATIVDCIECIPSRNPL